MKYKNTLINVVQGDITQQVVDAIVNPASGQLMMDAGLAGFIKKEGGPQIEKEAMQKGPLKPGEAIWTQAGNLKSKYIIHAVTMGEDQKADQTIIRCAAANVLKCACELKLNSLAFPALGCGFGELPLAGSAKIIFQEIMKISRFSQHTFGEIIFCLYDDDSFTEFDKTIRGYLQHMQETLGPGPYVTVDAIIETKDGIVLIERSNPPYGWALPGGFLDYGESLEQATIREAKEETNLDLINLRQFHTYSKPNRDPRFHTVSTVFIAQGRGTPRSGSDAKNLRIVKYEELPMLEYAFDHKEIIKEYLVEREFG